MLSSVNSVKTNCDYTPQKVSFQAKDVELNSKEPEKKSGTSKKILIGTALVALASVGMYLVKKGKNAKINAKLAKMLSPENVTEAIKKSVKDPNYEEVIKSDFATLSYNSEIMEGLGLYSLRKSENKEIYQKLVEKPINIFKSMLDKARKGQLPSNETTAMIGQLEEYLGKEGTEKFLKVLLCKNL